MTLNILCRNCGKHASGSMVKEAITDTYDPLGKYFSLLFYGKLGAVFCPAILIVLIGRP